MDHAEREDIPSFFMESHCNHQPRSLLAMEFPTFRGKQITCNTATDKTLEGRKLITDLSYLKWLGPLHLTVVAGREEEDREGVVQRKRLYPRDNNCKSGKQAIGPTPSISVSSLTLNATARTHRAKGLHGEKKFKMPYQGSLCQGKGYQFLRQTKQ